MTIKARAILNDFIQRDDANRLDEYWVWTTSYVYYERLLFSDFECIYFDLMTQKTSNNAD